MIFGIVLVLLGGFIIVFRKTIAEIRANSQSKAFGFRYDKKERQEIKRMALFFGIFFIGLGAYNLYKALG